MKTLHLEKRTKMVTFSALMFLFTLSINAQCSLTGWAKIAQGENFSVALKEDGTIWLWGRNLAGIIGTGSGTATEIEHPTQIGTDSNWSDISVGKWFILASKVNGDLYGWGDNDYGQLGNGNNTDQFAPVLIAQSVKSFSAGYHHTMIVKNDGTMWGAGYNDWSGLGVGTSVGWYNTFQQEASNATNWSKVCATWYNSYAIKTNGTLWSAGSNVEGQTGLGTPASLGSNETAVFTQVGTDTNWESVAGGIYHGLGLKTTGELWSWGHNNNGRLGLGTFGGIQYTPQQVVGTTWASIGATNEASSALKDDGSLWTWGYNANGKLGIGTVADVNIPTKVGTEDDWTSIPVRSGENSSGGIKAGAVMSWGWDGFWQLGNGDGTQTNSSVPTPVTCTNDLSVDDYAKVTFSVYPNPAKDNLFVKSLQSIDEVKIYSLNGVLVKTVLNVQNEAAIDVSGLASGIYVMKINNQSQGFKLVKQ